MTTPTHPEEQSSVKLDSPPPTPQGDASSPTDCFPVPPPLDPDLEGPFGRYTIVRRIGKGGMGRVYLAHDRELDRHVALKVPHLGIGDRVVLRERFCREARAAATLNHPNICPVHDVGEINGTPYLTMAYIEGQPLHEWAAATAPSIDVILHLVSRIALALEEAHCKGVIHRDLKPSNVLLDHRGEPVVMDFGLARRLQVNESGVSPCSARANGAGHNDEARLTSPGLIMGTPAYLPPEAVLGKQEASPAGDVYSLGVMLYELLTGRCPHTGQVMHILARILTDPIEPPSRHRPDLDPRLDELCLKALARQVQDRFGSMAEFAAAIAALSVAGASTTLTQRGATSIQSTIPTREASANERLALRILDLLRKWGWARAMQKIRHNAQRADQQVQRGVWQGFLDWMAGQRTADAQRLEAYQAFPFGRALRGWVLIGQASHHLRDRDYSSAQKLIERAATQGDADDKILQATIAHTRAAALVHIGQSDAAMPHLHQALDLFGREHFMTGRVLDTLGMAFAYKGNFPMAREFYVQSIQRKKQWDDEAGIAISHGQLGRLYLDWGHLDEAEHHFQEDLRLAQKLRSRWSEAQIYNHLGQVALARGEREAAAGKRAAARRQWSIAAGWLDESIRHSQEAKYPVSEAFAHKDLALVQMHVGDLDKADEQARLAQELFTANQFSEGVAKVHQVVGMILRRRERWPEAERRFRAALEHFESTQETDEIVRAYQEIARTLRDSGAPTPIVTRAYTEALRRAESARLDPLVRNIEEELHEVDVEAYQRHIYKRARGFGIDEDSPSLMEGTSEVATVLFIDLPGFAEFAQGLDPEAVLVTFNHLLADFADVLARHQARVIAYRGNGLMALARDARHAERGVNAALDLVAALEEFNRPRGLLGLQCFHVRIGISSGDLLLGNVGTYLKMDFTAIGATVNLAGALRNEAQPGVPCISRGTYDLVRDRFGYRQEPREVMVAGFGPVEVWDVVGRKQAVRR